MKIWFGHGSEHSANLVMIGDFKTAATAEEAVDLISEVQTQALADEEAGARPSAGRHYTDAMLDVFKHNDLMTLSPEDPSQLLYDFSLSREGGRVVITTDEWNVQALLKLLLEKGARIEVYSAHQHLSQYGRPTYTGES